MNQRVVRIAGVTCLVGMLWMVLAAAQPCQAARNPNPGVLPPHANAYGKTYGEWSILWWQWLASAPLDENPGLDTSGEFIDYGQSGQVWFLAPNYGGVDVRTGTIPRGTALFIDVFGFEASTREGHGETEEELRALADYVMSLAEEVACVVDGVPVEMMESYRTPSPTMFSLTVPEDNVFDLWGVPTPAGTYYPSVADGYYVMLAPLPVGEHTIHLVSSAPALEYYSDVTYDLTVSPGGHPMGDAPDQEPAQSTTWGRIKALYD